jgi:hypothetical protein
LRGSDRKKRDSEQISGRETGTKNTEMPWKHGTQFDIDTMPRLDQTNLEHCLTIKSK